MADKTPTVDGTVTVIQAPKKSGFLAAVNLALDKLVNGLGVNAAIAAGISAAPFLGWPILKNIFGWGVATIGMTVAEYLTKRIDGIIIQVEGRIKDKAYQDAINEMKKIISDDNATPEQKEVAIEDAKKAIDSIVQKFKSSLRADLRANLNVRVRLAKRV